jgi:hypothetical protein
MAELTEAQKPLVELLESSIGEEIDGIGTPTLDGELIKVDFQYGEDVFSATIDPDKGTVEY